MPTVDPQVVLRSARALERYGPEFSYSHYFVSKRLLTLAQIAAGGGAKHQPGRRNSRRIDSALQHAVMRHRDAGIGQTGGHLSADAATIVHVMRLRQTVQHELIRKAQEWHHRLFPLCRDMLGVATNPIPIKAAMKLLGRGTGELRLPLCPLDAAAEARLRETLRNHGLLRS